MSSGRSQWLPLLLIGFGLLLMAGAAWLIWQRSLAPKPTPAEPPESSQTTAAVFYRPADSDWWLALGADQALAQAVVSQLPQLDPATPRLPADLPLPQAIAAQAGVRVWQFAADQNLQAPVADATQNGRWHVEALADAQLLFWLPGDMATTAVDRVNLPPPGTGIVQRRWLQQRLAWPSESCEALPALLQQLPGSALLQFQRSNQSLRWQLVWLRVPENLSTLLQQAAAPRASADASDTWFWREADLTVLPRAEGCADQAAGNGFAARLWQQDGKTHAALARPGKQRLSGFPLPLPADLRLQSVMLTGVQAVASSPQAEAWLQQQSWIPEPGVLLAVQHRQDDGFAGISLQLHTLPNHGLQLQWQWPVP